MRSWGTTKNAGVFCQHLKWDHLCFAPKDFLFIWVDSESVAKTSYSCMHFAHCFIPFWVEMLWNWSSIKLIHCWDIPNLLSGKLFFSWNLAREEVGACSVSQVWSRGAPVVAPSAGSSSVSAWGSQNRGKEWEKAAGKECWAPSFMA